MRPLVQVDPLFPGQGYSTFFHEGQFLSINDALGALQACQERGTPEMLQKYMVACRNTRHMAYLYQALPPMSFPVARLRHVTIEDCFRGIVEDEKIDGSYRTFILNGVDTSLRVSCWGVHTPPTELANYRETRFAQFMQLAAQRHLVWIRSPGDVAELKDMMANSPTLREDSRYGNFQFSFSTKDLLAMYQDQHCGGRKPVLRVLGTEAYKQELVHWILIHSPALGYFDHLPTQPLLCTLDGTPLWTPESMSDIFIYHISNCAIEKKPMANLSGEWKQTYDPWIWNNVVFAFYLPGDQAIRINHHRLLENVQAVETAKNLVGYATGHDLRHPPLSYRTREHAQNVIEQMKILKTHDPRAATTHQGRHLQYTTPVVFYAPANGYVQN